MTTMQEALTAKLAQANNIPASVAQSALQEYYEDIANNLMQPKSHRKVPYGTSVPSKRQNRIRSGRASRRAAQSQRVLQAVGGVSHGRNNSQWTRAALKPATYEMCKVVENK